MSEFDALIDRNYDALPDVFTRWMGRLAVVSPLFTL